MNDAKKKLKKSWREEERSRARAAFPLAVHELEELFAAIEVGLSQRACGRTRHLANSWLSSRGKDVERVHAWLDEHNGFCDCQILSNVKAHVVEAAHTVGRNRVTKPD